MSENLWLLPEGIEEVLPAEAKRLENLRRELLDMYRGWGYELVMPPLIEYLESLLTGTGNDLDLQTFKLMDQLTGRMMGVRADMTPQVARIESHVLKRDAPTRLCYMGTVLRTRPLELGGSRSPLQVGAELYGHVGPESDVEIISLMTESLHRVGVQDILLDLGHVGVFRGLVEAAGLNSEQESMLFDQLQRKSVAELVDYLATLDIDSTVRDRFSSLCECNGDAGTVDEAIQRFKGSSENVMASLQTLKAVTTMLAARFPGIKIHFDLAELSGYRYHTGVVFAAYANGQGQAIAQGGRYDNIGRDFGLSRPATGFSADLKQWVSLSGDIAVGYQPAILVPWGDDSDLQAKVKELRQSGERVIQFLPGQTADGKALGCDRELVRQDGQWQLRPL